MRTPTVRTIYNSYDLMGQYKKIVLEDIERNGIKNVSANDVADLVYLYDCQVWEDEEQLLREFFKNHTWIIQGHIGRHLRTDVFSDFDEIIDIIDLDECDAIHIYDRNGHLYIECAYHNGRTVTYEIKRVTYRGMNYLENWNENYDDERTEEYVQNKIMRRYSTLPHFAHVVYG